MGRSWVPRLVSGASGYLNLLSRNTMPDQPFNEIWCAIGDPSVPGGHADSCDYRYIEIDNSDQRLEDTIAAIKIAIPESYSTPIMES